MNVINLRTAWRGKNIAAVGKMLLTCKKMGKQVPGALGRTARHLPGCATRDPETSQSRRKMSGRRGDAINKSFVIPILILSSNSSHACWDGTFTVFCPAPAAHAGHHGTHRLCKTGATTPRHPTRATLQPCCPGTVPSGGEQSCSWLQSCHWAPLHNPTASGKGFCSCFLLYCWRGVEKANSASVAGESGEMVDSGVYRTRSLQPRLFCYTLYIPFTSHQTVSFLSSQQYCSFGLDKFLL